MLGRTNRRIGAFTLAGHRKETQISYLRFAETIGLIGTASAGSVADKGIANNNTQNASPLAYERSFNPTNGSAAGMGRNGTFGQEHSDYVQSEQPYGQWLTEDWCGGNCGAD